MTLFEKNMEMEQPGLGVYRMSKSDQPTYQSERGVENDVPDVIDLSEVPREKIIHIVDNITRYDAYVTFMLEYDGLIVDEVVNIRAITIFKSGEITLDCSYEFKNYSTTIEISNTFLSYKRRLVRDIIVPKWMKFHAQNIFRRLGNDAV